MIREAKYEDALTLRQLIAASLGYSVPLELLEEQLQKLIKDLNHPIFVYEDESRKVLGYVEAEVYESIYSETGLNVLGLAVDKGHQGMGIGKQLMLFLETYASDKNLKYIRLNSGSHRVNAHAFYESLGYHSNKMQKRYIKEIGELAQ